MGKKKEKNKIENGQEIDPDDLKYSYDKALDIFKLLNDNYFKRVQIVMVALQAGLFIALMRLLSPLPGSWKDFPLPIIVTILGLCIAWIWDTLMIRQMQYMMLIKNYIQNIEAKFVELELPIDYFNVEASISKRFRKNHFKTITADIVNVENRKKDGKYWKLARFKWSKGECPLTDEDTEKYHKVGASRGNIVSIERLMSMGAIILWIVLLIWIIILSCY